MARPIKTLDPLSINERLYKQVGHLLTQLEDEDNAVGVTIPQRISALIAIGRIQTIFMGLRKEEEPGHVGSKPQQYSRTFKENAARGRKKATGRSRAASATVVEFDRRDDDAADGG